VEAEKLLAIFAKGLVMVATAGLVACESPRKRALQDLEQAHISPTSEALVEAVERGDVRVAGELLAAGVPASGADVSGRVPLRMAAEGGKEDFCSLLIDHKSDINAVGADGSTALGVAIERGQISIVGKLLTAGARADGDVPAGGKILSAAIEGNLPADLISKLLAAGADPNFANLSGELPLEQALRKADPGLIAVLLEKGADAFRPGSRGSLPIDLALNHPNPAVFDAFKGEGVKFAPDRLSRWLWAALNDHDSGQAGLLLSRGAPVDARGADGWLPIEWAVRQGQGTLVKLLADYGSPSGASLHLAAARGDVATTELLLALGADPDVVHPPFVDRPLSVAIRAGHDGLAATLIEQGAAWNFRPPEGQSPLHLAVVTGCARTVRSLLQAGADANAPFQLPVQPEFLRQVRPGVLRWALKMDKNVSLLMVAADSGRMPVARWLLAAGADKDVHTHLTNFWPINFASRRGDVKMMRLILGRDPQLAERRIVVHIGEQRARVFDSAGTEIFSTKVSTGKKGHDTPTGEYVITNKYREWKSTLYPAKMPYFQRLSCGDFGLHAGNVPGYPASHGCIRVPAENAVKLFAMTQAGDRVCIMP
jgi:ankyrin repeat protein